MRTNVTNSVTNFNEEHCAKLSALALLTHLGYQFIPPADCMAMRSNGSTNEKLYKALTHGVGVTQFVDGKKATPTIQIIDW